MKKERRINPSRKRKMNKPMKTPSCKKQHSRMLASVSCAMVCAVMLFSACAKDDPTGAAGSVTDLGQTSQAGSEAPVSPVSNGSGEPVSKTDMFFDTVVTITLYGEDKEAYIDQCFVMADRYENLFSNTIDDSDIAKINAANGDYVQVDPDTIQLIKYGLDYGQTSNGLFDITVGRLCDLWDFRSGDTDVPSDEALQEAIQTIDASAVSIRGDAVALTNPQAKIDLGGIAKGYIADQMRDYLKGEGIQSGIINLGGNVVVIGSKPDGSKYKVGIQKPFAEQNDVLAYVESDEISVVTSGVYERYFFVGDKLYHHILDPTTGYPADNGLSSVSIISERSVDGDGLSTTCFLLGLDQGMELIENTPGIEAVFVTEDNEIHTSSGVGDRLVIL